MPPLEMAGLTVFVLLLFAGVYAAILGLPGTLLILGNVFIYMLWAGFQKIGVTTTVLLILLSLIAEAIGFTTDMKSKVRFGPSNRRIVASLIGAALGAIGLTPWLLGLGTLLGIFLGAFLGMVTIELISQGRLKTNRRAPSSAMFTTAAGIFAKGSCAMTMTVVTLTKIYS